MTIASDKITPLEDILEQLRELARQLAAGWVKAQQARRLTELIGAPWQPLDHQRVGMGCPECGSVHLWCKCWRNRQLQAADFGTLEIPRRQVSCVDCGHCWMPFEDSMQIPSGAHGPRMLADGIERTLETSYQKAADRVPNGPSAFKFS